MVKKILGVPASKMVNLLASLLCAVVGMVSLGLGLMTDYLNMELYGSFPPSGIHCWESALSSSSSPYSSFVRLSERASSIPNPHGRTGSGSVKLTFSYG